jgi:hypothetical protein
MKRSRDTEILSIFGQLERVAANIMIEAGEVTRIDLKDFPKGAPFQNDAGQVASFAIIIKRSLRRKFDDLVAELRA